MKIMCFQLKFPKCQLFLSEEMIPNLIHVKTFLLATFLFRAAVSFKAKATRNLLFSPAVIAIIETDHIFIRRATFDHKFGREEAWKKVAAAQIYGHVPLFLNRFEAAE